jgi:predicted secreted protein
MAVTWCILHRGFRGLPSASHACKVLSIWIAMSPRTPLRRIHPTLSATLINCVPNMKTLILSLSIFFVSLLTMSQNIIRSDTIIEKAIHINESFDLQFLESPGAGYCWSLEKSDTSNILIRFLRKDLLEGDKPRGGRYISTYKFIGQNNGNYLLTYTYGRPWLNEKLYRCVLKIDIK